jgi:transcriptional regulator with XRE-family HTH domain
MIDMHHTIDSNWRRLATAVRQRRRVLGLLSLTAFAEVSGLSRRTISDLERAQRDNFDEATLGHLEAALGWANGSVQQILAGGEPIEVAIEGRAQSTAARRLAGAVARRRGALGLSRSQLAAAAGLPLRTINAVEQANVILKPKPRARLAAALDWSDDDVATILRTPERAEHPEAIGRHVVPSVAPAAVGRPPARVPADALEQLYGIFAELSDREQEHVLRAVHAVAGLARTVGTPATIDASRPSNGRTSSTET